MKSTEATITETSSMKIKTVLKFAESKKTGVYVAFVQKRNGKETRWVGVRENAPGPKKVCVVAPELHPQITLGQPYRAECVADRNGKCFIVTDITPLVYKAVMETVYIPDCMYVIEIRFGYKKLTFDLQSKVNNQSDLNKFLQVLKGRRDIKNHSIVVDEFIVRAKDLIRRYENDGFVYNKTC